MRSSPRDRAPRTLASVMLAVTFAGCAALMVQSPAASAEAGTCPHAGEPAGDLPTIEARSATVCLVNVVRAAQGLRPLTDAPALALAAHRHAQDIVARRYFAHVSPTGGTPDKRARRAGYLTTARRWVIGENLGWSEPRATTADVVAAWMDSPEHRAVILKPWFREIGVGVVIGAPAEDHATGRTFVLELGLRVI